MTTKYTSPSILLTQKNNNVLVVTAFPARPGMATKISDQPQTLLTNPALYLAALLLVALILTGHCLRIFFIQPNRRLPHNQGEHITTVPSLYGHNVFVYSNLAPGLRSRIGIIRAATVAERTRLEALNTATENHVW